MCYITQYLNYSSMQNKNCNPKPLKIDTKWTGITHILSLFQLPPPANLGIDNTFFYMVLFFDFFVVICAFSIFVTLCRFLPI